MGKMKMILIWMNIQMTKAEFCLISKFMKDKSRKQELWFNCLSLQNDKFQLLDQRSALQLLEIPLWPGLEPVTAIWQY